MVLSKLEQFGQLQIKKKEKNEEKISLTYVEKIEEFSFIFNADITLVVREIEEQ